MGGVRLEIKDGRKTNFKKIRYAWPTRRSGDQGGKSRLRVESRTSATAAACVREVNLEIGELSCILIFSTMLDWVAATEIVLTIVLGLDSCAVWNAGEALLVWTNRLRVSQLLWMCISGRSIVVQGQNLRTSTVVVGGMCNYLHFNADNLFFRLLHFRCEIMAGWKWIFATI